MSYIIWVLVGFIIVIGVVGGYFQLMLFSNLEKKDIANVFFGAWVFKSENLNEKGQYYRKAIFVCWLLVIILVFIIQTMR
jgi:uncharacterized RDD family membrane protein YckC